MPRSSTNRLLALHVEKQDIKDPFFLQDDLPDVSISCYISFCQEFTMLSSLTFLTTLLATTSGVLASPVAITGPQPTPPPSLEDAVAKRAMSCTFSGSNGYSLASVSKASCATIVLSSLTVPSGVTPKLEGLNDGTSVCDMLSPKFQHVFLI